MLSKPMALAARAAAPYRMEQAFGVPSLATRHTSRILSCGVSLAVGDQYAGQLSGFDVDGA